MEIKDLVKAPATEGKEKHVPSILATECETCGELGVTIRVGKEIFHPSTAEHHIQYIELFGITADKKMVFLTRFDLGRENTVPYVKTHVKKGAFKSVLVLSMCNIHGLWESSIEI